MIGDRPGKWFIATAFLVPGALHLCWVVFRRSRIRRNRAVLVRVDEGGISGLYLRRPVTWEEIEDIRIESSTEEKREDLVALRLRGAAVVTIKAREFLGGAERLLRDIEARRPERGAGR